MLAEIRRDLDRDLQLAALETMVELGFAGNVPMFGEIPGSREVFEEFPAFVRLILVEGGVGEVLDIERDAVADSHHQDQRAEERESEPDRIAQDFHRLAARIGPQPTQIEPRGLRRPRDRWTGRLGRCFGRARRRRSPFSRGGVFEIGDERVLELGHAAALRQLLCRADGENLAGVHQRDAVASLRFVHEVGREEDRHAVVAR